MVEKLYKEQKRNVGNPNFGKENNSQLGQNVQIADSDSPAEKMAKHYKVEEKRVRRAEKYAETIDLSK